MPRSPQDVHRKPSAIAHQALLYVGAIIARRGRARQAEALWVAAEVAPVYGEDFRKAIKSAKVEMISGGAHMMTLEDPGKVAAAVAKFLNA